MLSTPDALDGDHSAPPKPAIRAAGRAPRRELVHLSGGHYAPFMEAHEPAVAAQLEFLERHLLDRPAPRQTATASRQTPVAHV